MLVQQKRFIMFQVRLLQNAFNYFISFSLIPNVGLLSALSHLRCYYFVSATGVIGLIGIKGFVACKSMIQKLSTNFTICQIYSWRYSTTCLTNCPTPRIDPFLIDVKHGLNSDIVLLVLPPPLGYQGGLTNGVGSCYISIPELIAFIYELK